MAKRCGKTLPGNKANKNQKQQTWDTEDGDTLTYAFEKTATPINRSMIVAKALDKIPKGFYDESSNKKTWNECNNVVQKFNTYFKTFEGGEQFETQNIEELFTKLRSLPFEFTEIFETVLFEKFRDELEVGLGVYLFDRTQRNWIEGVIDSFSDDTAIGKGYPFIRLENGESLELTYDEKNASFKPILGNLLNMDMGIGQYGFVLADKKATDMGHAEEKEKEKEKEEEKEKEPEEHVDLESLLDNSEQSSPNKKRKLSKRKQLLDTAILDAVDGLVTDYCNEDVPRLEAKIIELEEKLTKTEKELERANETMRGQLGKRNSLRKMLKVESLTVAAEKKKVLALEEQVRELQEIQSEDSGAESNSEDTS